MRKIHERMQVERRSGISPSNKTLFLATCRDLELSEIASSWKAEEESTDRDELCWEPFDNWNNGPALLVNRER
jgi:hypothetical protein